MKSSSEQEDYELRGFWRPSDDVKAAIAHGDRAWLYHKCGIAKVWCINCGYHCEGGLCGYSTPCGEQP